MRMNLDTWLAAILFLGETFFASSIIAYWPLAVSMPPTKVCPQCKSAVSVDGRHVNAVILSFDANENQSV